MDFHQKTKELIDRQCRNVERLDFELNKPLAEELILQTYDIFNLSRPKKIKWCVDLLDKDFQQSTWSAGSARSAGSAWSAWSAWSAGSAGSAGSARSARIAGIAGRALDYDFDWYIFEFEYCLNPNTDKLPNENDKKYLEYCELLMQAKEAGLGYRIEWKNTLYLVPTPIVKINNLNQFHSDKEPAIRWKSGQEIYQLNGVIFPKDLWEKVVSKKMPFADILAIQDIDQRRQALKYGSWEDFTKLCNAEKIDEYIKIDINGEKVPYELWKFPFDSSLPSEKRIFNKEVHFARYLCPSTREYHVKGVPPSKTVAEALSWGMSDEKLGLIVSPEDWKLAVPLVNES